MTQKLKKVLSFTLALSMLLSCAPSVFAEEETISGPSEISFSASKYDVSENGGEYQITINRSGGNDQSVDVAFKAADFLATYGEDYVVLDANGVELPLSDGIAPEAADFKPSDEVTLGSISNDESDTADEQSAPETADAENTLDTAVAPETTEMADEAEQSTVSEEIPQNDETVQATDAAAEPELQTESIEADPDVESENVVEEKSTGSSLMDAQAKYLNLPETNNEKSKSVESVLDNFHEYFETARGAMGIITFEAGETEKTITVNVFDNDRAEADKIVLFALMGINGDDNTTLAANPTTYLNILDDEEYETPVISSDETSVYLTKDSSEHTLNLRRTSGVDYYTAVRVSTIPETALEGIDYEAMNDVTVSFVPGETEKSIKLSANHFDADKTYGVRIESNGTCNVENEYIKVYISSEDAQLAEAQAQIMLMSESNVIGSAETKTTLGDIGFRAGPSIGKQDGWHHTSYDAGNKWDNYGLYEEYEDSGRTWVSTQNIELTGIDYVNFPHQNVGSHSGSHGDYHMYINVVHDKSDLDNYWGYSSATFSQRDYHTWTWSDVDVRNLNDKYYFRLGARNDGTLPDNAEVWFGNNVTYKWRKFTLDANHSSQYFERFNYNYSTANGQITKIPMTDGKDDYVYDPGKAYFVTQSNTRVDGFYANASQIIKPVAENAANNAAKGIELEGVYLYTKEDAELYKKNLQSPFNDIWTTDNTVWVPASGVTVNADFIKSIYKYLGGDAAAIKVMPKYKQKNASLKVYTADNEKTYVANMEGTKDVPELVNGKSYYIKSVNSGLYLSRVSTRSLADVRQNKKQELLSQWKLVEQDNGYYKLQTQAGYMLDLSYGSTANGTNLKIYQNNTYTGSNSGSYAQCFKFNKQNDGSYIITTKVTGDKSCVDVEGKSVKPGANVQQWQNYKSKNQKWILEPVETTKYSEYKFPYGSVVNMKAFAAPKKTLTGFTIISASGTKPYLNDQSPELISLTMNEDTNLYPKTESQGMNIAYMPGASNKQADMTNRIYRMQTTVDANTTTEKTNSNGDLNIPTVYAGMPWMFSSNTPAGMVTKWTNGTGDVKNVNGQIDLSDDSTVNEENNNTLFGLACGLYNPVYGNVLAGSILQNDTKYYYEFEPLNSANKKEITGRILRYEGTFNSIAMGGELSKVPVSNAPINVAGTGGNTDSKGYFSMSIEGIPKSGLVSLMVNDPDSEMPYITTASANYLSVTLPAYECFKPSMLMMNYSNTANKIDGTVVKIYKDTLNIKAIVENNGSLIASGAKFYIEKQNGNEIDCSSDDRFISGFSKTNSMATLSFTPKSVMNSGDKIYVAFIDQNGREYKKIDLGYRFIEILSIKEFAFPLIGSTLLEDAYNSDIAAELIGNPLGDVSLGKLTLPDPSVTTVLPPGITDTKYQYDRMNYVFGDFSSALKTFKNEEDKKEGEDKDGKKSADNIKEATDKSGKDAEDGTYKTDSSFTWEINVKAAFGLSLTSREVDGKIRTYFEELDFLVGADFKVDSQVKITLPIGMNVIITGNLSGDITGIYQLKTDYTKDPTWDRNKVEYDANTFGLFKEVDHVNRYVYLMLNPKITLGLDVEYAIVTIGGTANFDFDMDFKFGLNKSGFTKEMYGDMTYWFDYHVKVLSFNVYEGKSKTSKPVKLFSKNANGHIEPDIMSGLLSPDSDSEISTQLMSRAYLSNASDDISLMSIDASEGTNETTLMNGIYPDAKYKTIATGDNTAIMVFLNDDTSRSAVNRTALYYRTFNGTSWTEPEIIDDDGTLDDYPEVFDLGDKVLVAWSSADRVLDDDVTVQEALTSLDIKTAVFDKASNTFGNATAITKTTTEDYTADVMPRAAYDEASGKVILYYTKTEYNSATKTSDLMGNSTWSSDKPSGSPSVIAYRFYDINSGKWNDADYKDEELPNMTDEKKEYYKENWYGQRFLDTRLNKQSGKLLRVVDTDSISYNGLSLYAWTVDYDTDLNTVDDRDVFMQIYNFEEQSFTHVIRMTAKDGNYGTPHFGRYDDNTYLFFSAIGDLGNGESANTSGIAYMNVTDPIKNSKFSLVDENNTQYYKLQYIKHADATVSTDGGEIPAHDETIIVKPQYAVTVGGYVNNFSVDVDKNERMYLTWSDTPENKENERQIFTSVYDVLEVNNEDGASLKSQWSEPFELTNESGVGYNNIDTFVLGDKLYIASSKAAYTETETGASVMDTDNSAMVVLDHTPFSKIVSADENALVADTKYIYPGKEFTLTSTVKNDGVKLIDGDLTFKFTMTSNGVTTDLGSVNYTNEIGGGKTASASIIVPALEVISDDLTFNAVISDGNTQIPQEMKAKKEASLISDGIIDINKLQGGMHELALTLNNEGNIDSDKVTVDVYKVLDNKRDKKINSFDVDYIEPNSSAYVGCILTPAYDDYTVDENGLGTIDLEITLSVNGKEISSFTAADGKIFDIEAINLLSKINDFKVSPKITAKPNNQITITPDISGTVDNSEVKVKWVSDNPDVVYVNEYGEIFAIENGTANLTGYLVPATEQILFNADATTSRNELPNDIPAELIKTANVAVTVSDATSTHSGGGGSSSTSYNVSFDSIGGNSIDTIKVNRNGKIENLPTPVKDGYTFAGWFTDEALTQAFTAESTVTANLKLYAKWTEKPAATTTPDITGWSNPFKDVSENDWFYDSVKYAAENKLFSGITDDEFAPNSELTRGMLVTVLYRAEGEPEITTDINSFDDVVTDSYYANAVAWAKENGIVNGMTDTEFAPNEYITREQIAAIMFRYSTYKDNAAEDMQSATLGYSDVNDISDWAVEAVTFCNIKGLMLGNDNNEFKPVDNVTRAETSAITQRFMESLKAN